MVIANEGYEKNAKTDFRLGYSWIMCDGIKFMIFKQPDGDKIAYCLKVVADTNLLNIIEETLMVDLSPSTQYIISPEEFHQFLDKIKKTIRQNFLD